MDSEESKDKKVYALTPTFRLAFLVVGFFGLSLYLTAVVFGRSWPYFDIFFLSGIFVILAVAIIGIIVALRVVYGRK